MSVLKMSVLKKMLTMAIAATLTIATAWTAMPVTGAAAALPALKSAVDVEAGITDVRYRRGGYSGGYYGGYGYYRPPVYLYAAPPVVYSYQYSGGHCAWLRRRARETGSHYWWNRYRREC